MTSLRAPNLSKTVQEGKKVGGLGEEGRRQDSQSEITGFNFPEPWDFKAACPAAQFIE